MYAKGGDDARYKQTDMKKVHADLVSMAIGVAGGTNDATTGRCRLFYRHEMAGFEWTLCNP